MVGEAPVRLHEERAGGQPREPRQDPGERVPGHPVGGVDGQGDVPLHVAEGRHVGGVGLVEVELLQGPAGSDGPGVGLSAHALDVRDAVGAGDRSRTTRAQLHAVVLPGVVTGGHAEPAVHILGPDGEVRHRRRGKADADDIRPRVSHPLDDRLCDLGGMHPHVPADEQALGAEKAGKRMTDPAGDVGVELGGVDAADVVGLEDSHGGGVWLAAWRAGRHEAGLQRITTPRPEGAHERGIGDVSRG